MRKNKGRKQRIYDIGESLLIIGVFISSVCLLISTLSGLSATPTRLPDDTNALISNDPAAEVSFDSSDNRIILPVGTIAPPAEEETQTFLEISDFDAALTSTTGAFCDASALMQGYKNTSLFIETGDKIYYIDRSEEYAIVKYDVASGTKEYLVPPDTGLWIGDLKEQNGCLFYIAHSPSIPVGLYMLSCDGDNQSCYLRARKRMKCMVHRC